MGFRSKAQAVDASSEAPASDVDSQLAGWNDALEVAKGERVVRAILAHYAPPMFERIWPDLDVQQYYLGYQAAPGSTPPENQRHVNRAVNYTGPLRRAEDFQ